MCRSLKLSISLTILLAVPSCGLLLELRDWLGPKETGSSELKAFTSESELLDYMRGQITQRNSWYLDDFTFMGGGLGAPDMVSGDVALDATGSEGAAPESPATGTTGDTDRGDSDFSQTTTQEVGVDEADVVKTDGDYIYTINSQYDGTSLLRIVRIAPPDQPVLVSETSLDGYGRDIYLHDDKVVAMTTSGGGYFQVGVMVDVAADIATDTAPVADEGDAGDTGSSGSEDANDVDAGDIDASPPSDDDREQVDEVEYVYQRPSTIVTILDVSTPDSPVLLSETKFEGTQSSSRMIDGVLHMVLSNYQNYYFDVLPMLGQRELDVSGTEVGELLPSFERVGEGGAATSGSIVSYRELYHPVDPDGYGVVTLVSLDVDNDAEFTAVGVVAEPGLVYSSLQAMYLTDTDFNWQQDMRTTTDIYKFAYVDRGAQPVATGSVPGRILNQYSMGEHQGYLRVATTTDRMVTLFGETTQSGNNVYVLGQTEEADGLTIVGKVEGIAPGERVTSARFAGDRGYVVTFEQIDPLHTLDLSDPTNPWVVGELEVPGFSTYLVPIDEDHLLAVGRYIPPPGESGSWAVQLSIFDVTDFAAPFQSANVILGGDTGADSEALWNPKAFTYWAEEGLVALPVSMYGGFFGGAFIDDATGIVEGEDVAFVAPERFEGLYIFDVSAEGGLNELGRVSTQPGDTDYFYPSFTRGVFIGDKVYAVTDHGVRGTPVNDLTAVDEELFFEESLPDEPPSLIAEPAPVVE